MKDRLTRHPFPSYPVTDPDEVIGLQHGQMDRAAADDFELGARVHWREGLLRQAEPAAEIGGATISCEGRFLHANAALCALLGYSERELLARSFQEITHPDDRALELDRLARMIEDNAPGFRMEKRFFHKDGQAVWCLVTTTLLRDDRGEPRGFVLEIQDNTPTRTAQQALGEREARIRVAFDGSPIGKAIVGIDGRFLEVNQALCGMLGIAATDLLQLTILDVGHPDDTASMTAIWNQLLAGEADSFQGERRCQHREGGELWVAMFTSLLRDPIGAPRYFVTEMVDITSRKEAEERLRVATSIAEEASRAKSEFVTMISHEIRTPLNAILGMAELLDDTELSADQRQYVDIFTRAGSGLLSIIDDVLDLSKIEAGRLNFELREFDPREVAGGYVDALELRARAKGLALTVDVAPDLPTVVLGDANRIRQILLNLLGNAIKFTENGEVGLTIGWNATGLASGELVCAVRDTGIGVDGESLQKIFEPFVQADSSTARVYGGTGLGLAICKQLALLMGGRLAAESAPGVGSTFSLAVPLTLAMRPDGPTRPETAGPGAGTTPGVSDQPLAILLVDDSADNRLLVARHLERAGHHVDLAADGEAGVTRVRSRAYDLVLMDIQMAVLDGLAATRAIRAWELETRRPRVPIVALTANADLASIQRCLEAGCDGHLSKPITRAKLLGAIGGVLSRRLPS